jgi:hypothetical protein
LKVERSSVSPENERLVLVSTVCAPSAAAAPIAAIPRDAFDGSRRTSLSALENKLPVLCAVPHGDVSRLPTCASAGAAVAIVTATTVAHVHNILTIELLVSKDGHEGPPLRIALN